MDKTMLKFRIEGYKRKVEQKVDDTKKAIGKFVTENPAEATAIILASIGAVDHIVRQTNKQQAYKAEQFKQNRTIYDHSTSTGGQLRETSPTMSEARSTSDIISTEKTTIRS